MRFYTRNHFITIHTFLRDFKNNLIVSEKFICQVELSFYNSTWKNIMCVSNKKKQRFKKRKLKVLKKNSILPDYADFFSLIEFPLFVVLCFNHRAYITKAYYEIFF